MKAVPYRQKQQRANEAEVFVAQKLESLVNVVGHPVVGLNVERLDVVLKLLPSLVTDGLKVGACVPILLACGSLAGK